MGIINNDMLTHHGIRGQKWGRRNGPPYPLSGGQKSSAEEKASKKGGSPGESDSDKSSKKTVSESLIYTHDKRKQEKAQLKEKIKEERDDRKTAKRQKKTDLKNRSILSNTELEKKISRLQNEKKFKDLSEEDLSPGKKFIKDVIKDSNKKIFTSAVTGIGLHVLKKIGNKIDEGLGDSMFNGGPKKK